MLYKYNKDTLQYNKVSYKSYIYVFLGALFVFSSVGFSTAIKLNTIVEKIPYIIHENQEKPTDENIRKYLIQTRIRFPKIVYQQIMLESNYLQSDIFKNYNNLLGMEVARIRPTTGQDIGIRWAKYDNFKFCLQDYLLWQLSYTSEIKTEEGYYQLLDKLYCNHNLEENKGELYSTRLKRIEY